MADSLFFMLSRSARESSIAMLNLGAITSSLDAAGVSTLGSLLSKLEVDPKSLLRIPDIRKVDLLAVRVRCRSLVSAMDERGDINWAVFNARQGVPSREEPPEWRTSSLTRVERSSAESIVEEPQSTGPTTPSVDITSGDEFISSFQEVIEAIVQTRENEADKLILKERLTRQPGERKTLDEIAKLVPQSITRERIRQREQKLLLSISQALLHGRSRRLGIRFQPSFASFWRRAAEEFAERSTVTFSEFMACLQNSWGVAPDVLVPHLPFITSILTSKATIPDFVRGHLRTDQRVHRALSAQVAAVPLTQLPLGKAHAELESLGVCSVGDLFAYLRSMPGPADSTRTGRAASKVASAVADGLLDDGSLDWEKVNAALGIAQIPGCDRVAAHEFLSNLVSDLDQIIRASGISKRAHAVFRSRIAVVRAARPTLAEAAAILKTHGPTVKREESLLLAALNSQLVLQDRLFAVVAYPPGFIAHWQEAADVHRTSNGLDSFSSQLSVRWGVDKIPPIEVEVLWAVMNEYPSRKPRSAWKWKEQKRQTPAKQDVIVLRGFRRVH